MILAVAIGIVLTIVCVTTVLRTWYDKEVDNQTALVVGIVGITVIYLVVSAVVLCSYFESNPENYNQDCTCSCECCERSETE